MDEQAKKTALRMIPYGLFVLTAQTEDGRSGAAAVNWVTQASFKPPQVAVCVQSDSWIHEVVQEAKAFALNILGKEHAEVAFAFFKSVKVEGNLMAGQPFRPGVTGAPILTELPAFVECRLVDSMAAGDHTVFLAEVVAAGASLPENGRPDSHTLWLRDLGESIFYGG